MREIKFRVWTGSEMEYKVLVGFLGAFYVKGMNPKDSASLDSFNTIYPKETPVMQFTGLKDKYGTEIYEGDVVVKPDRYPYFTYAETEGRDLNKVLESDTIPNYRATVEWIFAGFQTVLHCVNPEVRGISNGINEPMEEGEEWAIVGNIYDNPELVEEVS